MGVHPEDCADWEDGRLLELRTLAAEPKVRAIGEIGLDYYWKENPPRDLQQRVFRHQMVRAGELGLPVIVHDRDAHGDCMAIVREYPQVTGVFHCFSGSAEMARELMIETDSPYMAPEPCRGKRCDSSLVVHTCRRLAEIKGVSLEECARITLENGRRFFSIQEGGSGTA